MPPRPPPIWWREDLHEDADRMQEWCALSTTRRGQIVQLRKIHIMRKTARQDRIDSGCGSRRDHLFSLKEGSTYTKEEDRGRGVSTRRGLLHNGSNSLQFRLKHATGCVDDGCPLANDGFFSLLEHDHLDQSTKVKSVTLLRGIAKETELQKTVCRCLYHHWLQTKVQRNDGGSPTTSRLRMSVALRELKMEHGCCHPLHDQMWYASLVPNRTDLSNSSFFEVSHFHRSRPWKRKSSADLLDDVAERKATIHCRFCHKLFTICEQHKLWPEGVVSKHQFEILLQRSPAFVRNFEASTAGVDWGILQQSTKQKMSQAAKSRKRKREEN